MDPFSPARLLVFELRFSFFGSVGRSMSSPREPAVSCIGCWQQVNDPSQRHVGQSRSLLEGVRAGENPDSSSTARQARHLCNFRMYFVPSTKKKNVFHSIGSKPLIPRHTMFVDHGLMGTSTVKYLGRCLGSEAHELPVVAGFTGNWLIWIKYKIPMESPFCPYHICFISISSGGVWSPPFFAHLLSNIKLGAMRNLEISEGVDNGSPRNLLTQISV